MILAENTIVSMIDNIISSRYNSSDDPRNSKILQFFAAKVKFLKSIKGLGIDVSEQEIIQNADSCLLNNLINAAQVIGEHIPNSYIFGSAITDNTLSDGTYNLYCEEKIYFPKIITDIYVWIWLVRMGNIIIKNGPSNVYKGVLDGDIILTPDIVPEIFNIVDGNTLLTFKLFVYNIMLEIVTLSVVLQSLYPDIYTDLLTMSSNITDDVILKVVPFSSNYSIFAKEKIHDHDTINLTYIQDISYHKNLGDGYGKLIPIMFSFVTNVKETTIQFVKKYSSDCSTIIKNKINNNGKEISTMQNLANVKDAMKVILQAMKDSGNNVLREVTFSDGEKLVLTQEQEPAVEVLREMHEVTNTRVVSSNTGTEDETAKEERIGARMRSDNGRPYYQIMRNGRWVPATRNQYLAVMDSIEDNTEEDTPAIASNVGNQLNDIMNRIFGDNSHNHVLVDDAANNAEDHIPEIDPPVEEHREAHTNTQNTHWELVNGEYRRVANN